MFKEYKVALKLSNNYNLATLLVITVKLDDKLNTVSF